MSDIDAAKGLLADGFGRIREGVTQLTTGLTDETGGWRPDPEANSVTWLLWHLSRVQDDHVAGLAGALRRLIGDAALRRRLGGAGPARARALCDPTARLPELATILAGVAA